MRYTDPSGHYVVVDDLLGWMQFCQENPDLALELGQSDTQYTYQSVLPINNSGTGLSGESGTTTLSVSGNVPLSGNRSVVGDAGASAEPPYPEMFEGTGESDVNRVGSVFSILNYFLYPLSFGRTYEAPQEIFFTATLSFNSNSGNAQYNLGITSTYPQYYGYDPRVSQARMNENPSMTSPTAPASSYTYSTYVPSGKEMGLPSDPRDSYLSKATIDLRISYNEASNGSPQGILIPFVGGGYFLRK